MGKGYNKITKTKLKSQIKKRIQNTNIIAYK